MSNFATSERTSEYELLKKDSAPRILSQVVYIFCQKRTVLTRGRIRKWIPVHPKQVPHTHSGTGTDMRR